MLIILIKNADKAAQDPSSSAGTLWGSEEESELDTKSFKVLSDFVSLLLFMSVYYF